MARSSRPRRPYQPPPEPGFELVLTRGGGAELIDTEDDTVVWSSVDDEDFLEEFPDFLHLSDVMDILDYLVEVGELTEREADAAEVSEEFLEASDVAGMWRDR